MINTLMVYIYRTVGRWNNAGIFCNWFSLLKNRGVANAFRNVKYLFVHSLTILLFYSTQLLEWSEFIQEGNICFSMNCTCSVRKYRASFFIYIIVSFNLFKSHIKIGTINYLDFTSSKSCNSVSGKLKKYIGLLQLNFVL